MLFGDDLAAALLEDWTDDAQRPEYLNKGRRWLSAANPLWDPGAPAQVVEHLLLAARGGGGEQSWSSGRVAEVDQIVGWVGLSPRSGGDRCGRDGKSGDPGSGRVIVEPVRTAAAR